MDESDFIPQVYDSPRSTVKAFEPIPEHRALIPYPKNGRCLLPHLVALVKYVPPTAVALYSEYATALEEHAQYVEAEEAISLVPEPYASKLRKFQIEGVTYARDKKKCFIADEMGLGKTVQALVTVELENAYPCVIVCPVSLKFNWRNEVDKWLPHRKVSIVSSKSFWEFGVESFDGSADFYVINYEGLKNHYDELEQWNFKGLICDESHYLKNEDAKRTHLMVKLTKEKAEKLEVILLLTGTAILNRPNEIIAQLKIIDRFKLFGSDTRFLREFAVMSYNGTVIGSKNLEILNQRLRETCYIRRKKVDVLRELPDKQSDKIPVEITNREEYNRAEEDLVNFILNSEVTNAKFLAELDAKNLDPVTRFMAIQDYKAQKSESATRAETLVRIEILKQVVARGKLTAVKEWIDDLLESTEEKLVVFASHVEIQKHLQNAYPGTARVDADDDVSIRQANVDKFQNDPNCRIIVCSLQAGGLGITLTAASKVITVELGWNPAIHQQAEDRLHRIGQKNSVNAYYFVGIDTIDDWIMELLQKKAVVVQATVEGTDPGVQMNMYEELLDRLKRRRR